MSHLNLTPEEINATFPVSGMLVSKGGIIVQRCSALSASGIRRLNLRGLVKELSRRSLSNFAWMVASSRVRFLSLLTLTYGQNFPTTGKKLKSDFRAFMMAMRRSYGSFSYAWFLEFQGRGAPHFHILLTLENPTETDRAIVASAWSRIVEVNNFPYSGLKLWEGKLIRWSSGHTRDAVRKFHNRHEVWENVRSEDGAIRYVIQYATKPHQKTVPEWFWDVGRFWGNSRDVKNDHYITMSGTEDDVREMCALLGRDLDKWQVLPKIILINSQKFDKFRKMVDNNLE